MKFKVQSFEFKVYLYVFLFLASCILLLVSVPAFALEQPCTLESSVTKTPRTNGLVTTNSFSNVAIFGTSAETCITGTITNYPQFKVPTYDDWLSRFYKQSVSTKKQPASDIFPTDKYTTDGIYHVTSNLIIDKKLTGTGLQIIFVDGDLTFKQKELNYPTTDTKGGLVFIVKGNINIEKDVERIHAVLVSFGTICTASEANGDCPAGPIQTKQLVIYGGLISLNQEDLDGIKLIRALKDNAQAAELILNQPKYIPLLKGALPEGLMTEELRINVEQ